jgi:hypothetical protein
MRELTRAIVAASSTVTILTRLAQAAHQTVGLDFLRWLIKTTRSISMVMVLFFIPASSW